MSNYVFGGKLSYQDYLTARSFSQDIISASRQAGHRISMDISQQTREVIASNEALARENIQAMQDATAQLSSVLSDGFSQISYDLHDISVGISGLDATFHWGFSKMLASMGRMNDSFADLIKIAKTPAQTAAYEQYEIARDAFRQQLYAECLDALNKSIFGDHTSAGYKLEWRFHQMKGVIQLGFAEGDFSLMDHDKAEKTFLLAARYAKADYPEHAGQAFLSAGWAAYCQGRMKEAISHTEQAIAVYPRLGEAFFQIAKVYMAMDQAEVALPILSKAIDLDRFFAMKAAGDGDFHKYDERLRGFLDALRQEKYRQCVPKVKAALEKIQFWRDHSPEAERHEAVRRMQAFLRKGNNWPLIDVLAAVQEMDMMIREIQSLPITLMITTKLPDKIKSIEETYPSEQVYQENVLVQEGGFFREAKYEMQTRTRTVMMKRTVTQNIPGTEVKTEIKMEFCYIHAGTFIMGDREHERPQHQVTISLDFLMGKYPVTQAQWIAIMGDNPSEFKGSELPVENVSWNDCQDFIVKLNKLVGFDCYRFPTEAEWEYACRAGSQTDYYFGDDAGQLDDYAWYKDNSNGHPHTVGQKKPNAWGLHDMLGNVLEHCQDFAYDYTAESVTDPKGLSTHGSERVYRGGAWCDEDSLLRSTCRGRKDAERKSQYIGFRLVMTI